MESLDCQFAIMDSDYLLNVNNHQNNSHNNQNNANVKNHRQLPKFIVKNNVKKLLRNPVITNTEQMDIDTTVLVFVFVVAFGFRI